MNLLEFFIPLAVLIRVACFDWDAKHGQSVAILIACMWMIWTIAMGARQ
jgi:hypothetical protein